jgi:hypothetical protein
VASEARHRYGIELNMMACKKRRRRCALSAQSKIFFFVTFAPFCG